MVPPYSRTLNDLLFEMSERYPAQTALIWGDESFTYAQWRERASAVAAALARAGLRRGDVAGLLGSNRPEWLFSFFGAAMQGVTVAALNTWSKTRDLEYTLGQSGLKILVTMDRFRKQDYLVSLRELVPELWEERPGHWRSHRFPNLTEVVVMGDDVPPGAHSFTEWATLTGSTKEDRLPPGQCASPVDAAVIVYTSGSTARPKAVPLQHYAIVENGFNIGERQGLQPDDRVWVSVPLFWSYGCANALSATLTHGAAVVLQESFEANEALELIERHGCTSAYLLPNLVRSLLEAGGPWPKALRSLRTGVMIGLPEDLRRAAVDLGVAGICNIYGSTETYGNCCVTPTAASLERRLQSQGPPLPGVTIRITDATTGEELPAGEVGQVWVKGYTTPGYLNQPEANAHSFGSDGFFLTGDMGYLDEQGWFHFFARDTDMIKTGGINVSPLEVEEFLATHPTVVQVAVIGLPDPKLEEIVVAFVVLTPGSRPSEEELRQYCKEQIAGFKVPARVLFCDELPKTDTGKLSRRELRTLGLQTIRVGG